MVNLKVIPSVRDDFKSNLRYSDKIFLFNTICDYVFHRKDVRNRLRFFVEIRFSPVKFEMYEWLMGEFEENNHDLTKWESWIREHINSGFAERFKKKVTLFKIASS